MTVSPEYVRQIFRGLEGGNDEAFLNDVSDDVDWIVVGTHPLAGHYHAKGELVTGTCAKLAKVLQEDAQLNVEHLFVRDDQAVVILRLLATAKNGMRFDHRCCWILTFRNKVITKVKAYLDSAMVTQLFRENPISDRYEIKNRIAAITGGSSGIGEATTAQEFKVQGTWVIISSATWKQLRRPQRRSVGIPLA